MASRRPSWRNPFLAPAAFQQVRQCTQLDRSRKNIRRWKGCRSLSASATPRSGETATTATDPVSSIPDRGGEGYSVRTPGLRGRRCGLHRAHGVGPCDQRLRRLHDFSTISLCLGRSSGSMIPWSSHSPDDSTVPLAAPAVNSECAGHEQGTHNSLVGGQVLPPHKQERGSTGGLRLASCCTKIECAPLARIGYGLEESGC
jgi:hypothetical protein